MDIGDLEQREEDLGGQMSFLEHLDELRRRLINSVVILIVAFLICWNFSESIYKFLEVPVTKALAEARVSQKITENLNEAEKPRLLSSLKEGEVGRYVFDKNTSINGATISVGTSVDAIVSKDAEGNAGLFSNEPIFTSRTVIPKGIQLPADFKLQETGDPIADAKLIVTTAMEPFTLYVTVSLYSAVAFSLPLLLLQVWGFISPALYQHEKRYVTPFILLSSISFILGAAFAYYILFPTAVKFLLGIGSNFDIMLKATEYFDFIILIMLAMGIIFQMPAITYVLARIGIVSAGLLIRSWKVAIVIILIVAAVVSPTADIFNMMLYAAPMMILYVISIFIAWFFGKKRTTQSV